MKACTDVKDFFMTASNLKDEDSASEEHGSNWIHPYAVAIS